MHFSEVLNKIDKLQEEIQAFGKFKQEILNKITYRFRLDWNYNSNAIEGNSLTQQETRSIMINNVTIEGKPLKDVLEMKGHDKIISQILQIGKGELKLSEKRIQEIHKALIHEDDPEQAKKIGKWKTENNHLINYKGEKYEFTPYPEVPEKMHQLMNWLNTNNEHILKNTKEAIHPVRLAFEFHLKYISIHPFYDGNGRTARIFTNLILIAFGYPPIIIKVEHKNTYNQYLADIQAYGGNSDLLFEFLCQQLILSQEIVLKAVKGISIEEPNDLDKKLVLLEKELEAIDPNNLVKDNFNADIFFRMYEGWISDLLRKAIPMVQKFNKFFIGTKHAIAVAYGSASVHFVGESADEIISNLFTECKKKIATDLHNESNLIFSTFYGTLAKGGVNTFGCNYGFEIKFEFLKFWVEVDKFDEVSQSIRKDKFLERLLHKPLSSSEIDLLVKTLGDTIYAHIDFHTKKNGIR